MPFQTYLKYHIYKQKKRQVLLITETEHNTTIMSIIVIVAWLGEKWALCFISVLAEWKKQLLYMFSFLL